MNKSKNKGTAGETAVVKYLVDHDVSAQRRALHGNADLGDIEIMKPCRMILEVKSGQQTNNPSRSQLDEWCRQTAVEGANAHLPSALVVKRYRKAIKDCDVYFYSRYGLTVYMHLDEFVCYIKKKGTREIV